MGLNLCGMNSLLDSCVQRPESWPGNPCSLHRPRLGVHPRHAERLRWQYFRHKLSGLHTCQLGYARVVLRRLRTWSCGLYLVWHAVLPGRTVSPDHDLCHLAQLQQLPQSPARGRSRYKRRAAVLLSVHRNSAASVMDTCIEPTIFILRQNITHADIWINAFYLGVGGR